MTQPAISREVRTLEETGKPLFAAPSPLQLTEAGWELYQAADKALALLDEAIDRIAAHAPARRDDDHRARLAVAGPEAAEHAAVSGQHARVAASKQWSISSASIWTSSASAGNPPTPERSFATRSFRCARRSWRAIQRS